MKSDLHRFCGMSRRDQIREALERIYYLERRDVATWDDHSKKAQLERELAELDYEEKRRP